MELAGKRKGWKLSAKRNGVELEVEGLAREYSQYCGWRCKCVEGMRVELEGWVCRRNGVELAGWVCRRNEG